MIDPRERELFSRLVALPAAERESFLTEVCRGDDQLRERLKRLLEGHQQQSALDRTEESGPREDPDRIGPYFICQRVGEGGMGTVYEAEQRSPIHRRVALKIIKPGMDSREVIARFEAERQALALMSHPNIAAILDAGATEEGRPYFVMEFVAGEPITDYCDRQQLSLDERLRLFLDVCEAVQHAHQKGIIHRDLKPSNIMVTIEAERPVAKVIDFGVAKAMEPIPGRMHETGVGVVIGTPTYMSPEQADYTIFDVDTRSDVYALGMVLYELLVGDLPFDEDDLHRLGFEDIRRRLNEHDFVWPSARVVPGRPRCEYQASRRQVESAAGHRQCLRGDLDAVVMKALEKDRELRYGSAVELADDLTRYLSHQPVRARTDGAAYRLKKFVSRNRTSVVTAGFIAALLIGGTVVSLWQANVARRERDLAAVAHAGVTDALDFMVGTFADGDMALEDSVTIRELLVLGERRAADSLIAPLGQARRFHAMGMVYLAMGEWFRADSMLGRAVELLRAAYPNGHPELARSLKELGRARRRELLMEDAMLVTREALAIFTAWYGGEHEEVARAYNELSYQARAAMRWKEAEEYLRLAIQSWPPTNVTGADAVAFGLVEFGDLKNRMGDYRAADSLFRSALAEEERVLGRDHVTPLTTRLYLGDLYVKVGKPDLAEAILRPALAGLEAALGNEHRGLVFPWNSLADALAAQGQYEEAISLKSRGLEWAERHRGINSIRLQGLQLAVTLAAAGRFQESDSLFRAGVDHMERTFGPFGRNTQSKKLDYAMMLIETDQLMAAESLLVPLLSYNVEHAPASTELIAVFRRLGRIAVRRGEFELAEEHLHDAVSVIDEGVEHGILAVTHLEVQGVYQEMVALYEAWGRPDSERYRQMVLIPELGPIPSLGQ